MVSQCHLQVICKFLHFQIITYSIALASRTGVPFVDPIQYAVMNGKKVKREIMPMDLEIGTFECLWNEDHVSQIPAKSFPFLGLQLMCRPAMVAVTLCLIGFVMYVL